MNRAQFLDYCLQKPGAYEDMPFGPDTTVVKVMGKMFALTGAEVDASTANLKCDPQKAVMLREIYPEDVTPGYHMNKQHWNTVRLDGAVPDEEIREMVDESYALVVAGLKKADRERLRRTGSADPDANG